MRTVIMCMPRCGSKRLQHSLAEEQKQYGELSTYLPSPELPRSNFWCSLEEFMSHTFHDHDTFHATIEGGHVRLSGRYESRYEETINRLDILRKLPNYVVKHFVYPDRYDIADTMLDIADRVVVLRRQNIFDQVLSFAVARNYNNYFADPDFTSSLSPITIDTDKFVSLYKNFVDGDKRLAALPYQQLFLDDVIQNTNSTVFGQEYGPDKRAYVKNFEELKKTVDCL